METLLLDPRVWLAAGIALTIADILVGMAHFALAVGVACGLVSGVLFGQERDWYTAVETWQGVALLFAVFSVASVAVLRWLVLRRTTPDVNRY